MSFKSFDIHIQKFSLYTSLICCHNLQATHSKFTSVVNIVFRRKIKTLYLQSVNIGGVFSGNVEISTVNCLRA